VDEITLTVPREKAFFGVAHLVLAGLAARLDFTVEHLDDLQLALESLFEEAGDGDVTMALRVREDGVEAEVGPFGPELRTALAGGAGAEVDLSRVLETVVDSFEVDERDGAGWVTLRKGVRTVPPKS
jgi:hypothetical protein